MVGFNVLMVCVCVVLCCYIYMDVLFMWCGLCLSVVLFDVYGDVYV